MTIIHFWIAFINWLLFLKNNFTPILQESLAEHVEILQGKISQLENELSFSSKEEVGENMGHIMEVKSILSWL